MVAPEQLSWIFIPSAVGLGALHALEPGHGKSLMAMYLAGNRGTVGNAILMGLVVTVTHTSTIFALAVLSVLAATWFDIEAAQHVLEVVAAGSLVVLGVWLIALRARELWGTPPSPDHHSHDHHHDQ